MMADLAIVVTRDRICSDQVTKNIRRNIQITINGSVAELDLERAQFSTVTNRRNRSRRHGMPRNARPDQIVSGEVAGEQESADEDNERHSASHVAIIEKGRPAGRANFASDRLTKISLARRVIR